MSERVEISVFIPTYNGGPLFEKVLSGIFDQEIDVPFEVICIDSGSTDETLDIMSRYPVRRIDIDKSEFNHGLTRNHGAREARGDILILTVQDAIPVGRDWMRTIVSNFEDPDVAGVYCHQVPREDCPPFLRDRLRGWVRGEGEPLVKQVPTPMDFWLLSPLERWRCIAFDNVCSGIRRTLIDELPFIRRQFGEDITWAKSAILAGHKVVMDPRCAVAHSHNHSIWYEFRRAYLDHQNIHNLTGLQLAPDLHRIVEYTGQLTKHLFGVIWRDRELPLLTRLWWMSKVPYFAFSQNLAQYLGPKSDQHDKRGLWSLWDRIMRKNV